MPAKSGDKFLLKVGDGQSPENFTSLGALRGTTLRGSNTSIDVTNKGSGGSRELLDGGGVQSMTLSGAGVFLNDASDEILRKNFAAKSLNNYQIINEDGHVWQGKFLVTDYERGGDNNAEETFSVTLESSGIITYTA